MKIFSKNLAKKIAVISAHVTKGQSRNGTELGPGVIKTFQDNKLYSELENLGYKTIDFTEIHDAKVVEEKSFLNIKNYMSVSRTNYEISNAVSKAIKDGNTSLVLGGDHSIGLGSVHGTLSSVRNRVGLIWIDAHADINTPLTSPSGNFHGQPLSFLIKEMVEGNEVPKLKELDWIKSYISARDIVYLGLRDLDPDELNILKRHKIKAFSMSDIQRQGLGFVLNETFEYLTYNGELMPFHVSVDIDSLDPWYAPATGTPVLGGLSLQELMMIGNSIHDTNKLKTLDLVEVNPYLAESKHDREKTVFSAIRTILSFFGYTTMGTYPIDYKFPYP